MFLNNKMIKNMSQERKGMRAGILEIGIGLVILGVVFIFIGNPMIENAALNTPLTYNYVQDVQNAMATGNAIVMFGWIFGIVGVIVSAAGIAIPEDKRVIKEIVQEQKIVHSKYEPEQGKIDKDVEVKETAKIPKYCYNCGAKIEGRPKFCHKCGSKFG